MIMDSTPTASIAEQQSPAYALMKRGKRGAAAIIAVDCCNVATAAASTATQPQQQNDNDDEEDAAALTLVRCKLLDNMLDILLNPYDAIGEWNNLDWLRWLMAGGKTLDEFSAAVKDYDYGTCCGLVWTANYVAYRCRTCSISPCMSLCGDCFKRGDHSGHDFNMFRSQAGGACDCGDTSVMKPDGFCRKHSTNNLDGSSNNTTGCKQPPADLLRVAERILPRLLLRLVQYLRENSKIADTRTSSTQHAAGTSTGIPGQQQQHLLLTDLDPFLGMLHDLSALGAAMRRIMTVSLTNEKIYKWACDYYSNNGNNIDNCNQQTIYTIYTDKVHRYYTEAVHQYTSSPSSRRQRHSNTSSISNSDGIVNSNSSLSNSEDDDNDEFGPDDWLVDSNRKNKLYHTSFLQEIVFWTVRYEFPQKMVCFLLNMLPDAAYKESLTEAFVMHYGCVAKVLATTRDSDTLSNHIVHISVQLFSNEALATRMVDKLGLLRVMVSSLRRMMTKILIPSTLHDSTKNKHKVVDCSKAVMKEHCYWPLVSDLNNVLSHRPIAVKFMCDDRLLEAWFSYLSMFQGMNVNCRELGHHVEFEPNTYYAAFSAELEASAYPMWAMLSHLTSAETWCLTSRVLRACLQRLQKWLVDVGYYSNQYQDNTLSADSINRMTTVIGQFDDSHQFTFHLPLHRYLAVFLCQAVRAQGARIEDIIPHNSTEDIADRDSLLLAIATHPVRAQAAFYEIMQGSWVRNGLQIKGQAMTYIQSNFCISMVDADIYLLQLCLSELSDVNMFMSLILEKFKVYEWLHVIKHGGLPQIMDSVEYVSPSMESLLVFLATLVGVRTNLCSDEDYDYCQSQLEMVTLLCVSDKTHSQLMELMPERCGGGINSSASSSTSNTSNNENHPSNNQQSPPSLRDFETVLQAVAEYKRPQFEASGNMQQGLYIPLPYVWENLYDPVHVLLRAVHRRDFQSSMDRYTTYMRSIGLLQQNQNPWPPYRIPQKHHSAYQDPRKALLSRLFHSVVWHCLYRSAVFRDVSEHTLSLLIYLLDQAWICYNSPITTDNKTTPNLHKQSINTQKSSKLNTDDNMCSKRRIKITAADVNYSSDTNLHNDQSTPFLLLDRWYDNDDLVFNLCTTITHVELPPLYFHYYFGTDESSTSTTNTAAASTMAINLFDYFTSSVAAVASSSSSITVSNTTEAGNSFHQLSNIVPSLATIASNEIPVAVTRSSQSPPVSVTRPPFYSLNAAAAATSSTMADSALNRVKQRLQFLRPPPPKTASHSNTQLPVDVDTTAINNFDDTINNDAAMAELISNNEHHSIENDEDMQLVAETNGDKNLQSSLVSINESIISLLLRLHSHLSGVPDSYQPPSLNHSVGDEYAQVPLTSENDHFQKKIPLCGDGAFYVGRLLDRMALGSKSCYECIIHSRLTLWPKAVVMRETATREDEERERRERKRRAQDKQQQMMKEMAKAQRAFLENARRSGDLDSTDIDLQSQSTSTTNISVTNIECDEPTAIIDTSAANINSDDITGTSPSNIIILDDNSNSNNSTFTKELAHGAHGSQHKSTETVDCVICNQTVVVEMEQQRQDPVGLVILIQGTNVLAHRRHILLPEQQQDIAIDSPDPNNSNLNRSESSHIEDEQNYYHYWPVLPPVQIQQNQMSTLVDNDCNLQQSSVKKIVDEDTTTYASHSDRYKSLLTETFYNLDNADMDIGALTTTNPTPIGGNIHVQTCGHHLHLRCWNSYLTSLRGAQRFNSDRGEYSCPLCRQLANSLMPLMPTVTVDNCHQEHQNSTFAESVDKLTEIIKFEETKKSKLPKEISFEYANYLINRGFHQSLDLLVPDCRTIEFLQNHHVDDNDSDENQIVDVNNENEEDNIENEKDPLLDEVNKFVKDMITTTVVTTAAYTVPLPQHLLTVAQREKIFEIEWHTIVCIAWTNIQVELVQRNSFREQLNQESLLHPNNYYCHNKKYSITSVIHSNTDSSSTNNYYNMLPKRNCIAPLLKVLSASARSLMADYQISNRNPIRDIWYKLLGMEETQELYNNSNPPLLLRDPCSILLRIVLLLPTLEYELFDILVKLTYNMQLFVVALKVASAWNNECNSNATHHDDQNCHKSSQSGATEEIHNSSDFMDIDNGSNDILPSTSLMDITETNDIPSPLSSLFQLQTPAPPLFSQAVAFAKTIVFQDNKTSSINNDSIEDVNDEFVMDHDDLKTNLVDAPIVTQEDKKNILLLESYGRRCTLPFLRFATLLKKYLNGDNIDHLDEHHEMATIWSLQQSNLTSEQQKQSDQLIDNQTHSIHHNKRHLPSLVETNCNENMIENPTLGCQNPCHRHLSRDDYEFITLARYLKLLNSKEPSDFCSEENYDSNFCKNKTDQNNDNCENKQFSQLQLPSAMEAVIWPQWSYSTNYTDNVATTISRAWLMAFRKEVLAVDPIINPKTFTICPTGSKPILLSSSTTKIDPNPDPATRITMLTRQLLPVDCCKGSGVFNSKNQTSNNSRDISANIQSLLPTIHWMGPRLLRLPHMYDDVFQYYHGRSCLRCHGVPRETSVCLVCGTVVCLKENCCKTNNIYEAVQHSLECGGGTGMFLVVTSSSVVVIRGKRACLWGSVYLDAFGEEDRELKRGKPLYLSAERYRLLEHQWLAHRFDHTNKKWVWHRDAL